MDSSLWKTPVGGILKCATSTGMAGKLKCAAMAPWPWPFLPQMNSNFKKRGPYKIETQNGICLASPGPPEVRMKEISKIDAIAIEDLHPSLSCLYLKAEVPHALFLVEDVQKVHLLDVGAKIAHDKRFLNGTNVSFLERVSQDTFNLRTYERGVEGETLSCGTAAVAGFVMITRETKRVQKLNFHMKGGILRVSQEDKGPYFLLKGDVEKISQGKIKLPC